MRHRISRISVHQTAKTLAALYGLLALLFVPLFLVGSWIAPAGEAFPSWLAVLMPILYAALVYIFSALGAVFYNWIAGWAGGIEVNLSPTGDSPAPEFPA